MTARSHILWSAREIAEATGGRCNGDWQAGGVSIDSRALVPGDLFIALQGPNFDGHDYIGKALEAGAAGALSARDAAALDLADDTPLVVVADTLDGLTDLGRAARARASAGTVFVGITGSVGKTSTKEALAVCLAAQAETAWSRGSFNNHWGLPLSLARMSRSARYGVFELGMNHPGEIDSLSRILRPNIALITNIEAAHIGNFSGIEGIADAKAEIFTHLEPGGTAVLNHDSPLFARLQERAEKAGAGRIVTFGKAEGSDVQLLDAVPEARGSRIAFQLEGRRLQASVGQPGMHWVANALAIATVLHSLGLELPQALAPLGDLQAVTGRGVFKDIAFASGKLTLIDDTYNANPASMRASFAVLGGCRVSGGGRRIAVLGDMLELGSQSDHLHAALAPDLVAAGVDQVFTCGPGMAKLAQALPEQMRAAHAKDSKDLADVLLPRLGDGDTVLVKGSKGSRMDRVVSAVESLALHPHNDALPRAANGN
jgi:UDP-N-acetylmuramoyl-tripeptide--D-alanyl-D-alanine ligase